VRLVIEGRALCFDLSFLLPLISPLFLSDFLCGASVDRVSMTFKGLMGLLFKILILLYHGFALL